MLRPTGKMKHTLTAPWLFLATAVLLIAVTASIPTTAWTQEERPLAAYDSLSLEFEEAYQAEEFARALELAKEMNEVVGLRHAQTLYNIACVHSRLGNTTRAYEWLERAIDAGFWYAQAIMTDEDFAPLREDKRFRELVRGAWAKGYVYILEREERDEFQKPEEVMAALALKSGERVADIGAGTGYFTVRAARAVGPEGKVWAMDISQEMLDYLDKRLRTEEIANVEIKKVNRDDPELPPGGVDTILMVDTWHYIRDPEYAKKMRAGLAPGGRVVIIDYRPKPFEERPWGPSPEQQTSREELDAHMAEAGLRPTKTFDFLPEQYFVVYEAD